ncbi:Hypothetical_protein [Hexamita inflata]|uniref:Hypothetical_protein n=1 Tax=Hexamita inflata TaxID=28002 RepID=A0AA86NG26_9EUKA|nr:Hypothetical protein HINF_LOCUS5442 [Hexamita inflata]CAI9918636.1 Hypothetical protein HINF_LOCUS6281 [Hexamita inflata]CAI9943787.1 Hypothetical protein HINF_LOCUS31432 [Hexamita inflata]
MEIVETQLNPEQMRLQGQALELQENVFQMLVETRTFLEPILQTVSQLPLSDYAQFLELSPASVPSSKLLELEQLLLEQQASLAAFLPSVLDEQLFADLEPFQTQLAQPLQQQIKFSFADKPKLYKRVFQTRESPIGEQIDFYSEIQSESELKQVSLSQQCVQSDTDLNMAPQSSNQISQNTVYPPHLISLFKRTIYIQQLSFNAFSDLEFYSVLINHSLKKHSKLNLMKELKNAKERFRTQVQVKKTVDTLESMKFKRLEKFCIPQQRSNDEYMEMIRGNLFGAQ